MGQQLQLGDISVEVVLKNIKHVHLSVHPPTGRVRIAAPSHMNMDTIRVFAISKLDWIRKQQRTLDAQEREPEREYLERESHYLWGTRYLLEIVEGNGAPSVEVAHRRLLLHVRTGTSPERRQAIMEEWYRGQVKEAVSAIIARWERVLGVKVERLFVQHMRTKWGSCNPRRSTIRLNTELAKKPRACLEYVVVHELAHLLEPTHNAHFMALMERFMPNWRAQQQLLNRLPLRHEDWGL